MPACSTDALAYSKYAVNFVSQLLCNQSYIFCGLWPHRPFSTHW